MKTFYDIIYKWVADNFGQSEADDPSWSIEALADHLSKSDIKPDELNANTQWLVYDKLKEHFLDEDIHYYFTEDEFKPVNGEIETEEFKYLIGKRLA